MILAGNMGGTKSRVEFFAVEAKHPQLLIEETYKSEEYSGLEEVLQKFLGANADLIRNQPIVAACFGAAGALARPVVKHSVSNGKKPRHPLLTLFNTLFIAVCSRIKVVCRKL